MSDVIHRLLTSSNRPRCQSVTTQDRNYSWRYVTCLSCVHDAANDFSYICQEEARNRLAELTAQPARKWFVEEWKRGGCVVCGVSSRNGNYTCGKHYGTGLVTQGEEFLRASGYRDEDAPAPPKQEPARQHVQVKVKIDHNDVKKYVDRRIEETIEPVNDLLQRLDAFLIDLPPGALDRRRNMTMMTLRREIASCLVPADKTK